MLIEYTAGTVGEVVAAAQVIRKQFAPDFGMPEEIWYRGQSAKSYALLPHLFRPTTVAAKLDEESLLNTFRALATPLVPQTVSSDWDWYYAARHHGLPSRLLDWTESLVLAIYFALEGHWPKSRSANEALADVVPTTSDFGDAAPVIWIMDAGSLNSVSQSEDYVYVPGGEFTNGYLPGSKAMQDTESKAALPIALMPNRTNARIIAQQGMFTLHGHNVVGIDDLASENDGLKLGRVVLDRERIPHFVTELQILGVNRHGVYPDPDAVAQHVVWTSEASARPTQSN